MSIFILTREGIFPIKGMKSTRIPPGAVGDLGLWIEL